MDAQTSVPIFLPFLLISIFCDSFHVSYFQIFFERKKRKRKCSFFLLFLFVNILVLFSSSIFANIFCTSFLQFFSAILFMSFFKEKERAEKYFLSGV